MNGEKHTHVLTDGRVIEHAHRYPHLQQNAKAVSNRLARAIGHLQKVKQMIDSGDEDCSEILIQLSAVRSAITNTSKLILMDHLEHRIVEAIEQGDMEMVQDINRAIDLLIR